MVEADLEANSDKVWWKLSVLMPQTTEARNDITGFMPLFCLSFLSVRQAPVMQWEILYHSVWSMNIYYLRCGYFLLMYWNVYIIMVCCESRYFGIINIKLLYFKIESSYIRTEDWDWDWDINKMRRSCVFRTVVARWPHFCDLFVRLMWNAINRLAWLMLIRRGIILS